FKIVNDSFLPIKAATTSGYGVCSINGTGTCAGGIDAQGNYIQVGGIGGIVGDEAGGSWLARRAITEVFNSFYRFGKKTMLEKDVLAFLEIDNPYYMMDSISYNLGKKRKDLPVLCKKVFEYANKGDEVSIDLLKEMANNLARSVGGCIVNLDFSGKVEVVLAGSVYVKGDSPILIDTLKEKLALYTKKDLEFIILNAPPATGAIIWALELATSKYPSLDVRKNLCNLVEAKLNQMESR
ncbi:MAG: N-acetylglucosamine kinase, partial [Bacilli bacterium]|nr:N-acetylglucosamine kinase [Bacilli bacterium]